MSNLYDNRSYMINLQQNLSGMFRKGFLILFLCAVMGQVKAQEDYKFHHIYIWSFTKYIEWPSSYQSGDFVIAVVGQSDIIPYLQVMARQRTAGAQKIDIQVVNHIGELGKVHMVFIPKEKSNVLEPLLYKLKDKPTLVITEEDGLLTKGSGINFIKEGGRVKYEANQQNIESHGLKVSSKLLQLAVN